MNDRRFSDAAIADLHRRMDEQEKIAREQAELIRALRETVLASIVVDAAHRAAMEEMILLWRGSKIAIPALVVVVTSIWAAYTWLREHIRL